MPRNFLTREISTTAIERIAARSIWLAVSASVAAG
jgi:hypothetical protein